jgi:hypothetical protein
LHKINFLKPNQVGVKWLIDDITDPFILQLLERLNFKKKEEKKIVGRLIFKAKKYIWVSNEYLINKSKENLSWMKQLAK